MDMPHEGATLNDGINAALADLAARRAIHAGKVVEMDELELEISGNSDESRGDP